MDTCSIPGGAHLHEPAPPAPPPTGVKWWLTRHYSHLPAVRELAQKRREFEERRKQKHHEPKE